MILTTLVCLPPKYQERGEGVGGGERHGVPRPGVGARRPSLRLQPKVQPLHQGHVTHAVHHPAAQAAAHTPAEGIGTKKTVTKEESGNPKGGLLFTITTTGLDSLNHSGLYFCLSFFFGNFLSDSIIVLGSED